MTRRERERLVLQIVEADAIQTQTQLVGLLRKRGVAVTQATVSRDIKRLGLVKTPAADGTYRYGRPNGNGNSSNPAEAFRSAFREFATRVAPGEGLVAIRTHSGCANAVAVALDETDAPGVVATLAGDDAIFVMTRSIRDRDRLISELRELL